MIMAQCTTNRMLPASQFCWWRSLVLIIGTVTFISCSPPSSSSLSSSSSSFLYPYSISNSTLNPSRQNRQAYTGVIRDHHHSRGVSGSSSQLALYRPARCYPNNCQNDGQCIINPQTYKSFCRCPPKYVGASCEYQNPCSGNNRCFNGGTCQPIVAANQLPSFKCLCPLGFSASMCEVEVPNICQREEPCRNGGRCVLHNDLEHYQCNCVSGWRGDLCEERDNCASSPCKNNAKCVSHSNGTGFTCECAPGFRGKTCAEDINECAEMGDDVACNQKGICHNVPGSYMCTCEAGYTGQRCETVYIPCQTDNPCQNGGDCIADHQTKSYRCNCPVGFTGKDCEENIDDCGGHLCQNGGTCVDDINTYTCLCPSNFTGPYCSLDVDECSMSSLGGGQPCQNGATCANTVGGFNCICVNGWTGPTCSENIDDCANAPCFNGATCHDRVGSYYCQCPPGKTGLLCHLDDACASNPCHAGAICDTSPVDGTYVCSCPTGYKGTDCMQDIDECHDSGSPCEHGGTCVNTPGSYRCDCAVGFAGARCEVNINECDSNPCQNEGTCLDERGSYRCVCMPGYTGVHCESNIDECQSNPCQNNAICTDLINGYRCLCTNGYDGTNCEKIVDQCYKNPCRNNGTCHNEIQLPGSRQETSVCTCPDGFNGRYCEYNINDCESNPCFYGKCVDMINSFKCICNPGYTGMLCQNQENECWSNPCLNSGTCHDMPGKYRCQCPHGFRGEQCEIPVDQCMAINVNCQNGGTCINQPSFSYGQTSIAQFRCQCMPNFSGVYCEIDLSKNTILDQKRRNAWARCPHADYCYEHFSDNVCNEDCNNRDCLFDGFDCRTIDSASGGNSGSSSDSGVNIGSLGPINSMVNHSTIHFDQCNRDYNPYCEDNYANGHCDYGCNIAECAWDGLDCENDPSSTDYLRGELIIDINFPYSEINNTNSIAGLPPQVKKLIRMLSILIGSVLRIREIRENNDRENFHNTKLIMAIDNRKCRQTGQCFENSQEVASFLSVSQNRQTSPVKQFLRKSGIQMQFDAIDEVQDTFLNPGHRAHNLTYIVIGVMFLLFVGILLGALVTNNRKKVARGITWFPENFFANQMPMSRSGRHHANLNASAAAACGNYTRSRRGATGNNAGLSHSNSIRSGCPDGQEMRQFKSRDDLMDEKSPCAAAAIYEEPSECRSWSSAHYEATTFQPHDSMTPPLPTPSIDAIGPNGLTPLMVASAFPNLMNMDNPDMICDNNNTVHELLMNGADVSLTCDKTKETCLHLAARYARADAAKHLIEAGSDCNAQDATGRTPLHAAIAADARGVFEILLRNRTVNLNAKTNDGTTPLILAARMANEGMLEQLVSHNCDLNMTDDNGKTALHWAASVNNVEAVRVLLQHGSDRDAKNNREETPLFLAAREGAYQCAKLLLDYHANRDITDNMDQLPRDVALARMHTDILELLETHDPSSLPPPPIIMNNQNNGNGNGNPNSNGGVHRLNMGVTSPTPSNWGTLGRNTAPRRKPAQQANSQMALAQQQQQPHHQSNLNLALINHNNNNNNNNNGNNNLGSKNQVFSPNGTLKSNKNSSKPAPSLADAVSTVQHQPMMSNVPPPPPPPRNCVSLYNSVQANLHPPNPPQQPILLLGSGAPNNTEIKMLMTPGQQALASSGGAMYGYHQQQISGQQPQQQPPQHVHQNSYSGSQASGNHSQTIKHQHQISNLSSMGVTSPPSFYDFVQMNSHNNNNNNGTTIIPSSSVMTAVQSSAMISPPSRPPPTYDDCFNKQQQQQQQQQSQPIAVAPRHNSQQSQQLSGQLPPTPTATTAPTSLSSNIPYQNNQTMLRVVGGQQQQQPLQTNTALLLQQPLIPTSNTANNVHPRLPDSYPTPSPDSWGSLSTSSPMSANDWTINCSGLTTIVEGMTHVDTMPMSNGGGIGGGGANNLLNSNGPPPGQTALSSNAGQMMANGGMMLSPTSYQNVTNVATTANQIGAATAVQTQTQTQNINNNTSNNGCTTANTGNNVNNNDGASGQQQQQQLLHHHHHHHHQPRFQPSSAQQAVFI